MFWNPDDETDRVQPRRNPPPAISSRRLGFAYPQVASLDGQFDPAHRPEYPVI